MKKKKDLFSIFLRGIVYLAAALTFFSLIFIVGYILIQGVPNLKPSLFAWTYTSENVSLMPALTNTILMVLLALIIALPLGVITAIYLVEYAGSKNKIVGWIRLTTETLSGIPSIIYGLFGMLFFVVFLGWGLSLISGAATLSIMILPLIMRTAEEALKSVPDSYREASYGLGAGRLRTIFKIVLPSAMQGIIAGVILGIGRIVGETAALIYTAGAIAKIPNSIFSSTRTLSVHMYLLSSEGFNTNEAFATAVVLLGIVLLLNTTSTLIAKKVNKK